MRDADARVLVCAAQRAPPFVLAINCGGAGVTAARCTSVAHACCSLEIPGEPDALLRGSSATGSRFLYDGVAPRSIWTAQRSTASQRMKRRFRCISGGYGGPCWLGQQLTRLKMRVLCER